MPAKSKAQQRMMGMAHAIQKGEMKAKPGSPSAKVAATMKPGDVKDFASTSTKELPMHSVSNPVKKLRRSKAY